MAKQTHNDLDILRKTYYKTEEDWKEVKIELDRYKQDFDRLMAKREKLRRELDNLEHIIQ